MLPGRQTCRSSQLRSHRARCVDRSRPSSSSRCWSSGCPACRRFCSGPGRSRGPRRPGRWSVLSSSRCRWCRPISSFAITLIVLSAGIDAAVRMANRPGRRVASGRSRVAAARLVALHDLDARRARAGRHVLPQLAAVDVVHEAEWRATSAAASTSTAFPFPITTCWSSVMAS